MRVSTVVKHNIQKYILSQLTTQEQLRFRDMRPPRIDTNLYSYHLKLLQKNGLVDKADQGYSLTLDGMAYTNSVSRHLPDTPDVKVMLIIQDGYGGTLMVQNQTQPFINRWTLPQNNLSLTDSSIAAAAERLADDTIDVSRVELSHAGDCYIRVRQDDSTKLSTLVHVFYGTIDSRPDNQSLDWIAPHHIADLRLEPGIDQVIARTFFRDRYFFEEFVVDW